ncbi:MAG: 30S ribosomal protein S17 [Planctomycetaceae bacterium]|nr:30S ribosomal protein S17 [Planctomycetaceae bacterium]
MRKRLTGTVAGDKMDKTRRVEVERTYRHPKYGKTVRRRLVCHVHDEQNESHLGDLVEIVESRPLSRLKRWALVRIVRKSDAPNIVVADPVTAESR